MGEGRQGDNASKGANSGEPQSTLTGSYSVCMVCVCVCVSGKKRGKKTENYIMYARVVRGAFTQPACVCALNHSNRTTSRPSITALMKYHHSGFKETICIFIVFDNLVLIIHVKAYKVNNLVEQVVNLWNAVKTILN